MFTGIIRNRENVVKVTSKNQSLFVAIGLPGGWRLKEGDSISINGICSTVRKVNKHTFEVEYMAETIKKTTVADWGVGFLVHLERSLTLDGLVDGHLVSGHIDAVAKIAHIKEEGGSKIFTIKVPSMFMAYVAPKGSIALDGVSLTVVDVWRDRFTVSLVSHTISHTNFDNKQVGDIINCETDIIAKYVNNTLKHATKRK